MTYAAEGPSLPEELAVWARPVGEALAAVEERLQGLLPEENGSVAQAVYRHILEAGGKRLRPLLTLLSCAAAGGDPQNAVVLATGIEIIHLASLIHDDVIDEATERRGRPTARARWGNRISILVGDLLIAEVFRQLSDELKRDILEVLANAVVEMCQAELGQEISGRVACEEEYLAYIRGKTAALLSAACAAGALRADNEEAAAVLRDYGLKLGLAFQITDDLLDLYGDPAQLGKPVWQDLRKGRWTLPVLTAWRRATPERRRQLEDLLEKAVANNEAAAEAARLIETLGGRDEAKARAEQWAEEACDVLERLPASTARESLAGIARFVVERKS